MSALAPPALCMPLSATLEAEVLAAPVDPCAVSLSSTRIKVSCAPELLPGSLSVRLQDRHRRAADVAKTKKVPFSCERQLQCKGETCHSEH